MADFEVPPGTVFKDLSGLTADEQQACFSLDVRDLPADQQAALQDAISHLDEVNAWLGQDGPGYMVDEPALTRKQMRERGLICAQPHDCNDFTTAEDD